MANELLFNEDTIRQYIQGELNGDVLIKFEEELKSNVELQEEVEVTTFLIGNYNVRKKKHLRTLVDGKKEIPRPKQEENIAPKEKVVELKPQSSPLKKILRLAIAAVVIGFLGLALLFTLNQTEGTPQIASSYLEETYAAPVVSRGEDEVDKWWNSAIESYKNKDFKTSAGLLQKVVEKGNAEDKHFFYLGLSQLYQEGQTQKAIDNLSQIKDGYYSDASLWYKSLAYLKLDKKEEAKKILGQLLNSSRKEDAEKLLKELE